MNQSMSRKKSCLTFPRRFDEIFLSVRFDETVLQEAKG